MCVTWIGNSEATKLLTAAASKGVIHSAVNGAAAGATAATAAAAIAAAASAAPTTAANASSSSASNAPASSNGGALLQYNNGSSSTQADGYIDPFSLDSVLTIDPSIPQLDGELIDALFQAILATGDVLLSDLSKTFKTFTSVTGMSGLSSSWVNSCANTHPLTSSSRTIARTRAILSWKWWSRTCCRTPPPTTLLPVQALLLWQHPHPSRWCIEFSGERARSAEAIGVESTGIGHYHYCSSRRSASSAASAAPTQDVFAAAALLASSVPASQIDDNFRLECLRLVFVHHGNCGLQLTDIGNHFTRCTGCAGSVSPRQSCA